MNHTYALLALALTLCGCFLDSQKEMKKSDFINTKKTNIDWLKQNPSFQVVYQTGFTQNDSILVAGDFYLVTDYSDENVMSFLELSNIEICNLLTDARTRTNCVLLLNQIHLIPNLEYVDANRNDWDSTIVNSQMPMWRKKYECN